LSERVPLATGNMLRRKKIKIKGKERCVFVYGIVCYPQTYLALSVGFAFSPICLYDASHLE